MNKKKEIEQKKSVDNEMPLLEHLAELRLRLIYTAVPVILGSILAYFFSEASFSIITYPFTEVFPDGSLVGTAPASAFVLKLKVAIFVGILIATPVIAYHIWRFVAPALYQKEKSILIILVGITTVLFLCGAFFAHSLILPFALRYFFEQYQSIDLSPVVSLDSYLSLVIRIAIGFGIVFQLPLLSLILARLGLIDVAFLLRYFRHACVVMFVVAAVLTPPDIISQVLLAIPLLLLYGLSIVVVKFFGSNQRPADNG